MTYRIHLYSEPNNDEERRVNLYTMIMGQRFDLAWGCLGSSYSVEEARENAKKLLHNYTHGQEIEFVEA